MEAVTETEMTQGNERETGAADDNAGKRDTPQYAVLEEIVGGFRLFRGTDDRPYIEIPADGAGKRVRGIDSSAFRDWLNYRAFDRLGKPANERTIDSFIKAKAATALYGSDGPPEEVNLRVGEHAGSYYIDLADKANRAVEIDGDGWRIVSSAPVSFRLPRGAKAMPEPTRDGGIELLRPFVNVESETDFALVVGWLLGALRPGGPYPMLVLQGEQGSSKSTLARFLKLLVDDSSVPLKTLPRAEEGLLIAAQNSHLLAFDNLSRITPDMADQLCRLATGGGISKRRLYTNDDEFVLDAKRPVILNGIDYLAERPDLVSRSIIVRLRRISDSERETETELTSRFESARSAIVGALLDIMSFALGSDLDASTLELPRMADHAEFLARAEGALELPVKLLDAFRLNNADSMRASLDADPLAVAVFAALDASPNRHIEDTPTQVLEEIRRHWPPLQQRQMPANAQLFSNRLGRITPSLREEGIRVEFDRKSNRNRTRIIRIMHDPQLDPEWRNYLSPESRRFNEAARLMAGSSPEED